MTINGEFTYPSAVHAEHERDPMPPRPVMPFIPSEIEVTQDQGRVLVALFDIEYAISAPRLALAMHLSHWSVDRALQALEAKGMVKQNDPPDSTEWYVTDLGEQWAVLWIETHPLPRLWSKVKRYIVPLCIGAVLLTAAGAFWSTGEQMVKPAAPVEVQGP